MGEKEGNNGDEKKKNNGGERIEFRLLINKKERFKGSIEGSFEGSFEGVEYMKVDCVHNKLRAKVDLGKPREKKVDGKLQKKADGKKPTDKEVLLSSAPRSIDVRLCRITLLFFSLWILLFCL